MPEDDFKYWAFISYSHRDKKWSDRLHRALETFRIPRRLRGKPSRDGMVPKRIFPVFRDREELPSSSVLGENINQALAQSRYLIAVCSPKSAASRWVNEEVKTFKALGRQDRVLCLIVDGEPNASDKPELGLPECFPEAIRFRVLPDHSLTSERVEPIAADARPDKDGWKNAKLKLIAGILGVNYDEIKQREKQRQRVKRIQLGVLATGVLVLFIYWWRIPGTLNLMVTPTGTTILIGDRHWRASKDALPIKLKAGYYTVTFDAQGHDQEVREVKLERGAKKDLTVRLHHHEGILEADCVPIGAEIAVDGVVYGSKIRNFPLGTGEHLLSARASGHFDGEQKIVVTKDKKATAFFYLDSGETWKVTSPAIQGEIHLVDDMDQDAVPDLLHNFLDQTAILSSRTGDRLWSYPAPASGLRAIREFDLGGTVGKVTVTAKEERTGLDVFCVRSGSTNPLFWRWSGPPQNWGRPEGASINVLPDVNGDGVGELVFAGRDGHAYVLSGKTGEELLELVISQETLSSPPYLAVSFAQKTAPILFLSTPGDPYANLSGPKRFYRVGAITFTQGAMLWTRDLHEVAGAVVYNLNGNDQQDILWWTESHWEIIDGTTGEAIKSGQMPQAGRPPGPLFADVDNDGFLEWLMIYGKPPSDLIAMRLKDGEILWKRALELLPHQTVHRQDLHMLRAPNGELLLMLKDGLAALNPLTGETLWRFPGRPEGYMVADWDGDGNQDILVGTQRVGISCLDSRGRRRWTLRLGEDVKPYLLVPDIDSDGLSELIIHRHAGLIGMVRGPRILWTKAASAPLQATPIVLDADGDGDTEVIQVGPWGSGRHLLCLDGATGARIWESEAFFHPNRRPGIGDWDGDGEAELIALGQPVGGGDSTLLVYRAADGHLKQSIRVHPNSDVYSVPAIADLNGDGSLDFTIHRWWTRDVVAIGGLEKSVLWRFPTEGHNMGGVRAADLDGDGLSDIIAPSLGGRLYAVNGIDGSLLWEASIGHGGSRSPPEVFDLMGNGTPEILLISLDGQLRIMDGTSGDVLWAPRIFGSSEGLGHPVITKIKGSTAILAPLGRAGLVALDWSKRKTLWRGPRSNWVIASPNVADLDGDGIFEVVVATVDGWMLVLDLETGETLWKLKVSDKMIEADPIVADLDQDGIKDILIASHDFKLRAISGRGTLGSRKRWKEKEDRYVGNQ